MNYDPTARQIETPSGTGRYVDYNSNTGMVTVEMDNECLVEFDGLKCKFEIEEKEGLS